MKVYFYHTQDTRRILREWMEGIYPGHLLYGATHLPRLGIDVIPHLYPPDYGNRFRLMWLTAWRILTCGRHYDALYATSFRGLELIILLRALHLYRRPVVVWHHQPIVAAKGRLREWFARFFYRGIDQMCFFSRPIVDESLRSRKARPERMHVVDWGADLEFYDRIRTQVRPAPVPFFVSTGKEQRDIPTLVEAFRQVSEAQLEMFLNERNGTNDYQRILGDIVLPENVHLHILNRLMIGELASIVAQAQCVVISCLRTNYTVGLTTLVEAIALGLPVVTTRNATFPFDIDREGVGIGVDYADTAAWQAAVHRIATCPDEARAMGERGRELAESRFNLENTAAQVAAVIRQAVERR